MNPDRRFVAAMVVTYNRVELLRWTLEGVHEQTCLPDELVVVDNGSNDGTEAMVKAEFPTARYLRLDENLGYGGGLAMGMSSYDREYDFLWLLEDDSRPKEMALEKFLRVASTVPRLGVIGLGGGMLRHGVPVHGKKGYPFTEADTDSTLYRSDFLLLDPALVSRGAIEAVGYPRGDFFMAMEDVEYTHRIGTADWLVLILDEDLVERNQIGSGSETGIAPPLRGYYQSRSHLILALEHRSPREIVGWLARQVKFGIAAILFSDRKIERVRLRILGGWHAFRGFRGRTLDPASGRFQ